MINERWYSRHSQVFPAPYRDRVIVVGAGAIGSHLVAALVKLGCLNLTVYDPDVVEAHNLGNQIYGPAHVGMTKIAALANYFTLLGYLSPPFSGHAETITPSSLVNFDKAHVFLAVDSMAARREILEAHCAKAWWVYDTRIGVDHSTMISFDPGKHIPEYLNTWAPDSEIPADSPCGTRITVGSTVHITVGFIVKEFMERVVGRGKAWAFAHYAHPNLTTL